MPVLKNAKVGQKIKARCINIEDVYCGDFTEGKVYDLIIKEIYQDSVSFTVLDDGIGDESFYWHWSITDNYSLGVHFRLLLGTLHE